MDSPGIHRPRNVDWKRAAAILYGDWGTSKAYVAGLAFFFAGYASLQIIVAVCALTALVAYNYIIVCKNFPDGGGVYSAARNQSRLLAVVGALLLVANFIVTAALSCWAAMSYFGVNHLHLVQWTAFTIAVVGAVNFFGPKHTGSMAITLAVPTVLVVVAIAVMSLPFLSFDVIQPMPKDFKVNWLNFVGVILALSGVEAIANLTGVMKLDPGSTMDKPKVTRTAIKAILPVALEVVLFTILMGWAMISLPRELAPDPQEQRDYMLRFLGQQYGTMLWGVGFGKFFGLVVGVVMGLLLVSAVNTAIAALIGLFYMLSRDGEMPKAFSRLSRFGVPWLPLVLATVLPILVVVIAKDMESLARLYAIGVVGAITVNLGSCTFNKNLKMRGFERAIMAVTFAILFAVELTIARTNNDALFFAVCVLAVGLALRGYAQKLAGMRTLTVSAQVAAQVAPEYHPDFRLRLNPGQSILVAARGMTPVLQFALEEARLRQATLYVLYINKLSVTLPGPLTITERPRWQDDPAAAKIMYAMIQLGQQHDVPVLPIYIISDDPAGTILDQSATLGVDILLLGVSHRKTLESLLRGNIAHSVGEHLPENIQLIIYG